MILVDTSVLIDYFKGRESEGVHTLDKILEMGIPYGINDFIYQELLQGMRSPTEFETLKDHLETLPFYALKQGRKSFEKAAYLHFLCRKSGLTIRSTIDLLIAQTAIENGVYLLHNDHDFTKISQINPDLKIYPVGR